MSQTFAVIMAGGVGTRFWPKSRGRSPKQFLEILSQGTMIENTLERVKPLVEQNDVFVVTNRVQVELLRKLVPWIPPDHLLAEPLGRNTAACIGLAALWIERINPEALMMVSPADHIVKNPEEFVRILRLALRVAEQKDALVTIGIKPTHPETGYGYIQSAEEEIDRNEFRQEGVYRVKTFAEKPNLETAERFLKSGDFFWNSGIFMWKARVILREIELHLPDLYEQLRDVAKTIGTPGYEQTLEHAYRIIRSISIDYGIMEQAGNVFVVKGDFGWSDVGSWDEVVRLTSKDANGNSLKGLVFSLDSKNNYIDAGSKVVAALGIEDLIVIETDDALLICKKGKSQDVKEVVDYIRRKQMNDYL
jgi:mannose-1-phosphate guanylyltransferase